MSSHKNDVPDPAVENAIKLMRIRQTYELYLELQDAGVADLLSDLGEILDGSV